MPTVRLPVLPTSTPPPPEPFAAGSLVRLRTCPDGEAGVVRGTKFGRVVVHWPDLQFTGRHLPAALIGAEK